MARPPNPRIRAKLRNLAVDYVLSHGVANLSLRPLAKALRTNARMLVYHFGSREGLMREILAGLREREDAHIRGWFKSGKGPHELPQFLRWYWQRLSAPRGRAAARLLFELYALALRDAQACPGVLTDPLRYWQNLGQMSQTTSKVDAAEATLLLAATRGLLLDLCATEDETRVKQAMNLLARLLESRSRKKRRQHESKSANIR